MQSPTSTPRDLRLSPSSSKRPPMVEVAALLATFAVLLGLGDAGAAAAFSHQHGTIVTSRGRGTPLVASRPFFASPPPPVTRAMSPVDEEDSTLFPQSGETVVETAKQDKIDDDAEERSMSDADRVLLRETKKELLEFGKLTKRGFDATRTQKKRARELCEKLAEFFDPASEPCSPFYQGDEARAAPDESKGPTLRGKWELVYTDAPDIVTLDGGPLAASKLGRIGQECDPPFIRNVIEWKKPDWARNLPLSGTDDDRVLQKVCTEAVARKDKPRFVELQLVGLDVFGFGGGSSSASSDEKDGEKKAAAPDGPAEFFEKNPVELKGPVKAPFGRFEVLYLDGDIRVIRTGQNFLAVNKKVVGEEWF